MQYRKSQEQSCQRQAHEAHAERRYQPSRGRHSAMHVKASSVNALVVLLTATCDACEAALVAVRSEPKGPKGTPSKWQKGEGSQLAPFPLLAIWGVSPFGPFGSKVHRSVRGGNFFAFPTIFARRRQSWRLRHRRERAFCKNTPLDSAGRLAEIVGKAEKLPPRGPKSTESSEIRKKCHPKRR